MRKLGTQGYKTYARLLSLFDIYLTDDPEVIGYMIPKQAAIVLNQNLDIDEVSTIVRHEMLHEWLTHAERTVAFNEKHPGLLPNTSGDVMASIYHELSNIAADFEISNVGYTESDKRITRAIHMGDEILQGLVTEDQYPGWENKTFEEMYEALLKKNEEELKTLRNILKKLHQLSAEQLEDLANQIEQAREQAEQESKKQKGNGQKSDSTSQPKDNKPEDGQGQGDDADKKDKPEGTTPSSGKGSQDKQEQQLDKMQKEVQDIQNELDKMDDSKNPFDTPQEQDKKEQLAGRVTEIKDALQNADLAKQASAESRERKQREQQAKIRAAQDRISASPLHKFRVNLNNFIANEIEEQEDVSYARIHPSYEDSEFIVPGRKSVETKHIPVISVYHDVSGSFDDPKKTEGANQAIATLNKYVREGDIIINRYYFADRVASTRSAAGGGNTQNQVLKHIQETQPDNVIILTDGDQSYDNLETTVPGAVWMLFYDDDSPGLMQSLRGKKQNKYYMIDY